MAFFTPLTSVKARRLTTHALYIFSTSFCSPDRAILVLSNVFKVRSLSSRNLGEGPALSRRRACIIPRGFYMCPPCIFRPRVTVCHAATLASRCSRGLSASTLTIMDTLVAQLSGTQQREKAESGYGNLDARGGVAGMEVPGVPDVSS